MIDSREGLAIAIVIFYVPALFIAATVAFRHGFSRQSGWIFLVILAVIRLIGSICEIIAQSESSPSYTLYEIAAILQSVGITPLLLAMLGMLMRLHDGLHGGTIIPTRFFRVLQLLSVVALILSIVGGDEAYNINNSASTQSSGHTLLHVGTIILVIVFLVQAGITVITFLKLRQIAAGEKILLYAVALSLPLLLVRLIYAILVQFDSSSSTFNITTGSVIVEAIMSLLMEFLTVIIYLTAGLLTKRLAKGELTGPAYSNNNNNNGNYNSNSNRMNPLAKTHNRQYDNQINGTV